MATGFKVPGGYGIDAGDYFPRDASDVMSLFNTVAGLCVRRPNVLSTVDGTRNVARVERVERYLGNDPKNPLYAVYRPGSDLISRYRYYSLRISAARNAEEYRRKCGPMILASRPRR